MSRPGIINKDQIISRRSGQNGFKYVSPGTFDLPDSSQADTTSDLPEKLKLKEQPEERLARKHMLAHSRSQFLMSECSQEWPKLSELKSTARQQWTIPTLKAKIEKVKNQHRHEIERALRYSTYEEQQAINDQYIAFDYADSRSQISQEFNEISMFTQPERFIARQEANDFLSRLRYAHIKTLEPLYKKMKELQAEEEKAKLERARTFPVTPHAWRQMDTKDAKLKVARFLQLNVQSRDDMLRRELNWTNQKKNVDALLKFMEDDIVFAREVSNFVKENQTTDPRRRPTA